MSIASKFNNEKFMLSEKIKFFIPKIDTAPKIGIEIKNATFAESTLLKFNNLAAVIAIPDLLTPGTRDKIWKRPIKNADFKVKFSSILFSNLNLSLIKSRIPKKIVVQAIVSIFLNISIVPVFTRIYPTIITGREEINIFKNNNLFATKLRISL